MATTNGGTRIALGVLSAIVAGGVLGLTGWVASSQADHEKLSGHPAIIERHDALQADVTEIKSDVKELLRRP